MLDVAFAEGSETTYGGALLDRLPRPPDQPSVIPKFQPMDRKQPHGHCDGFVAAGGKPRVETCALLPVDLVDAVLAHATRSRGADGRSRHQNRTGRAPCQISICFSG
jgi:hypothetical protein